MKGHKEHHHRKHHAEGGPASGDAHKGDKDYEMDEKSNPQSRDNAHEIDKEAEAKKHGGRAKRKRGGHVHHEHGKHLAHAKHVGHVEGEEGHKHAGRKPRKSGGRAGSDLSPLSSAHKGTLPPHHKDARID